jgi:hypothetical protein
MKGVFGTNEANEIFGDLIFEKAKECKIFEEAADVGSIDDFAKKQMRSQAMACALTWLENGDYSFGALADSVATIADLDGDEEFTNDEEAYYNDLLTEVGYAFTALGADAGNIQTFIDNEDDEEGAKLGTFLSEKMQSVQDDDDTLVSHYAVSNAPIMESVIKVVRNGQIVFKTKRIGRPHKMTAAQKAGLKIARRRAFTGAAKLARAKSMRMRRKRGM